MSDPIITVENLSKQYLVGHRTAENWRGYTALRDVVAQEARNFTRKALDVIRGRQIVQGDEVEEFWALRNVSFEIERGEAVGILGRNGAGKSTLLKILSRITEPTQGRVRIGGRISSLLEVGTGFHPELTGRENIFLNGAILGMTRSEIRKKFDEIVAFAEVENFLDMPVKYYSSGMYVRLAFAVAAHLEPEILVVDEVLAVGDALFQRKCLSKMSGFGDAGRTVLFVSHNLSAVLNLCQKAIVLEQGQVAFQGNSKNAVDFYIHNLAHAGANNQGHLVDLRSAHGRLPKFQPWLQKLEVCTGEGKPLEGRLAVAASIQVTVEFELRTPTDKFDPRLNFRDLFGQMIFVARSSYEPSRNWGERCGVQRMVCEIPELPLVPGEYRIDVALVLEDTVTVDYIQDAYRLIILERDFYGTGQMPSAGIFVQRHHWRMESSA